jgi:hypothetical protein
MKNRVSLFFFIGALCVAIYAIAGAGVVNPVGMDGTTGQQRTAGSGDSVAGVSSYGYLTNYVASNAAPITGSTNYASFNDLTNAVAGFVGDVQYFLASGAASFSTFGASPTITGATTINTTIDQIVNITATWSTANISNSATIQVLQVSTPQ